MAALVAVMVLVSVGTFDWHSVRPATLKRMPVGETIVMVVTVAVVVATRNLSIGVVVGTITAMVIFARRVAHLADVTAVTDPDGTQVVYAVTGELFFASSNDLVTQFDYAGDPGQGRHRPDRRPHLGRLLRRRPGRRSRPSTPGAARHVEIIGLNEPSAHLHGRLTGELTAGH